MTEPAHEPFCAYQRTADARDLRPVSCGACAGIWHARADLTCWGVPRGSTANGVITVIWLAVLACAAVWAIVVNG